MTSKKALQPKHTQTPASDRAKHYATRSRADNTRRTYSSAWAEFTAWAQQQDAQALPAEPAAVIEYLTALAESGAKVSTIEVKRAAVAAAHRTAGHPDPTATPEVRAVLSGIRRELGRPPSKKAPVTVADLLAIVEALPDNLAGLRDRALILTGFAGAFRRSELVALDVEDVRLKDDMKITIRRGKTDQEGKGAVKSIPRVQNAALDAIGAMRTWLDAAEIRSGPIFRKVDRWGNVLDQRLAPQSVAYILKNAAQAAGLDPRQFAGHSLRSGFVSAAADAGAQEWEIAEQTGHRSTVVLRGYIQASGRGAKRAVLAAINGEQPVSRSKADGKGEEQ